MPATAKRIDVEQPMNTEARLSRLETKTETVQRDVTEIKEDQRRFDAKFDAGMRDLNTKIDTDVRELNAKIDTDVRELNAKIDTNVRDLSAKIDGVGKKVDGVKDAVSALAQKLAWFLGVAAACATAIVAACATAVIAFLDHSKGS